MEGHCNLNCTAYLILRSNLWYQQANISINVKGFVVASFNSLNPGVVWYTSWKDMNKDLVYSPPDKKLMTYQSKSTTEVLFAPPMSLIKVTYKSMGEEFCIGAEVTQWWVHNEKHAPNMSDS